MPGLYGGPDGEDVLDVLAGIKIPIVSVLHTVLAAPTPHQHAVLQRIIDASAALVVLSHTAARALLDGYVIDAERIQLIPHGAPTPSGPAERTRADGHGTPRDSHLGLDRPGQGDRMGHRGARPSA